MTAGPSRALAAGAAALLVLGVGLVTVVSVREPLAVGDYVEVWGLKGRALARTGDLTSLFRVEPRGPFSHPEYPPLWPAVLAACSGVLGRWDDLLLTPLWPFLCLAASLAAVRLTRGPWCARLLAGAAISLLPYYRRYTGYAEALLVLLLLLAIAEADRLDVSRHAAFRLAVLLTLAAWTKQEGALAGLVVAGVLLATRRVHAGALAGLSVLLFAVLPWQLFVARFDPERPVRDFALTAFSPASLAQAGAVLFREGVVPNAAWILGAAALLALAPATRGRRRPLLAGTAVYVAGLLLAFLFAQRPAGWIVFWSWDRLAFVPVAVLLPVLAEAAVEAAGDG